MHHRAAYYSNLAHACDVVLQIHPVAEDAFFVVSVQESSLPQIITDLHPRELWLTSKTVSLDFGHGTDGFWIGWGPDETRTNSWTLEANVNGSRKVVYAETR